MPSERPAPVESKVAANSESADGPRESDVEDDGSSGSSFPPDTDDAPKASKRRRFETRLPGLIRRGIEKSIEAGLKSFETGRETTGAVREAFNDVKIPDIANAVGKALQEAKLPRELASLVFTQLDDAKNDVVRIIAREVRDFLDATDLAGEIKSALTSLSFEIRTEVRFIPNAAGTGVRPDVKARGQVKRRRVRERRRAREAQKVRPKEPPKSDEG
jgi:hypothetical protein